MIIRNQLEETKSMDSNRVSGFDPATGICWNFRNPGDNRWCKCPACTTKAGDRDLISFGRCRSGRRWFWTTRNLSRSCEKAVELHGWAEAEEAAVAAGMAAVRELKATPLATADMIQGMASYKLKLMNEAKRAARPAPDTSDARAVEYLYAHESCWGDGPCACEELTGTARWNYHLKKFQITKKTAKRIYYARDPISFIDGPTFNHDRGTGFIDREKIERDGEIWTCQSWDPDWHLYLQPPQPETNSEPPPDISRLKAEMAAAHPDHGGTSAAFIKARIRYVEARRRMRSGA
jgi:hypothetical protein